MGEPRPMTSSSREDTQHPVRRSREQSCDKGSARQSISGVRQDSSQSRSSDEGRGYRLDRWDPVESTRRRDVDHGDIDKGRRPEQWGERQDEWRCPECRRWNESRRSSCAHCQRSHRFDGIESHGIHNTGKPDDEEVDEFGRKKGSSSKPSGPRWPPPFDRRSSSYVFDARSGMFYHAASQFFFDPKSKLYYGNKEQKYYLHKMDEYPHFRELESQTTEEVKVEQESKVEQKPVIAIALKTKVLTSRSDKSSIKPKKEGEPLCMVSRVKKQHASNIDRWSERGREIAGKGPVVRTKSGQPVCLLCKRKFSILQKLERHEEVSVMHQANISKYGKRVKMLDETCAAAYARDRAWERRVLHGPDVDLPACGTLLSVDDTVAASALGPQDILDQSNIGNQMLQKLGWQAGRNLGRAGGSDDMVGTLREDWERIERIAEHGRK